MQINNPNNDFEYSGPPKRQAFGNAILSLVVAALFLWYSYHLYSQFSAAENGQTVTMPALLWITYDYAGKWPIITFFVLLSFGFIFATFDHIKKYKASKHQDF